MLEKNERYMVFRMPDGSSAYTGDSIPYFWGWSRSKAAIKVLRAQRDPKKYKVLIMNDDEIGEYFSENQMDDSSMINYIRLGDVTTGEMISLFTTKVELQQMEVDIQKLVINACSFEHMTDPGACVEAMLNMKKEYAEVLEYIGFRPKEISYMFDSADSRDDPSSIEGIEYVIGDAYELSSAWPEEYKFEHKAFGSKALCTLATRVIYSIQSAVRVLRKDL